MIKNYRNFVIAAFAGALVLTGGTAQAQDAQSCQPGLVNQFNGPNNAKYLTAYTAVVDEITEFTTELNALVDQATYAPLYAHALAVAAEAPTGRVVVALPDGTVVVDTGRPAASNTYASFLAKTVNENHNSRMAFFQAQAYQCAVALESKRSSTTGVTESYVALRLGNHLDSEGTVRYSVR